MSVCVFFVEFFDGQGFRRILTQFAHVDDPFHFVIFSVELFAQILNRLPAFLWGFGVPILQIPQLGILIKRMLGNNFFYHCLIFRTVLRILPVIFVPRNNIKTLRFNARYFSRLTKILVR
eukprot:TRINITY_DN8224_c0_g1_i4.p1 TRINITY_DN8224_c0_g1~~TRINITY_DN8224_c0_g1_i4.p1  ORF type:complete len:120 (+),score=4.08 TRINITY_DN8224_c0_g1_i4:1-360(+)